MEIDIKKFEMINFQINSSPQYLQNKLVYQV